jgi:hypothetical protein
MNFLKFRGKIFKVQFTPQEQKVIDEEINRQVIERDRQFTDDFDYMVMRVLRNHFGFGPTRLKRFYEAFSADYDALLKHYEMPDAGVYIARKEMNEIGCNIEKWNQERSE